MSNDLGIVTPVAPNVFRWPYQHMVDGDFFYVDPTDKALGSVRQYAYLRGTQLGCKFSVEMEGDLIKVTRFPKETDLRSEPKHAARFAEGSSFEGDDKHLGVLVPSNGHWAWPFRTMEPGQYFHVSHGDKNPEVVRAFAANRARHYGYSVSVQANAEDLPGHARVEYLDGVVSRHSPALGADMSRMRGSSFFLDRGLDYFGDSLLGARWPRPLEVEVDWKSKPPLKRYTVGGDEGPVGIEIEEDLVRIGYLPEGTRADDDWDAACAKAKERELLRCAAEPELETQRDPVDNVLATLVGSEEEKALAKADELMR